MKQKILVVNEDCTLLAITKISIGKFGYDVKAISESQKIYTSIKEFGPHLIILEERLNEKEAMKLDQMIKSDASINTPSVILYSGLTYPGEVHVEDFIEMPYDMYFYNCTLKPFLQ
ncbi:MAG: hypothetical protein H0V01_01240 [Bacteroidetes bacterium]|nr:hypothetical protein [Bacteroidota bacterium]HET6243164.1 hypothetical protein [Bacteroidia bacterium]